MSNRQPTKIVSKYLGKALLFASLFITTMQLPIIGTAYSQINSEIYKEQDHILTGRILKQFSADGTILTPGNYNSFIKDDGDFLISRYQHNARVPKAIIELIPKTALIPAPTATISIKTPILTPFPNNDPITAPAFDASMRKLALNHPVKIFFRDGDYFIFSPIFSDGSIYSMYGRILSSSIQILDGQSYSEKIVTLVPDNNSVDENHAPSSVAFDSKSSFDYKTYTENKYVIFGLIILATLISALVMKRIMHGRAPRPSNVNEKKWYFNRDNGEYHRIIGFHKGQVIYENEPYSKRFIQDFNDSKGATFAFAAFTLFSIITFFTYQKYASFEGVKNPDSFSWLILTGISVIVTVFTLLLVLGSLIKKLRDTVGPPPENPNFEDVYGPQSPIYNHDQNTDGLVYRPKK